MEDHQIAEVLVALHKSIDLIQKHIATCKYDLAIERCERTKKAIRKVINPTNTQGPVHLHSKDK